MFLASSVLMPQVQIATGSANGVAQVPASGVALAPASGVAMASDNGVALAPASGVTVASANGVSLAPANGVALAPAAVVPTVPSNAAAAQAGPSEQPNETAASPATGKTSKNSVSPKASKPRAMVSVTMFQ